MAILDFFNNPNVAIAAGLLSPSPNQNFGQGLSQGVAAGLASQRANLRQEILRQEIQRAQAIQASREQQQAALNAISAAAQRPGFTGYGQQAAQHLPAVGIQGAAQLAGLDPRPPQTAAVKNALALGMQPDTQEFNNFVREQVLRPSTQVNVNQGEFKVPTNFRLNPNAGQPGQPDVIPISGGPATRQTPEQASKTALSAGALQLMPGIRSKIITPDGGIDRGMIATISSNLPFSEGRLVRTQILDSLEAKLRAESGAAVPQTEVERAAVRFMPSLMDKDSAIVDKLDRLEKFLSQSLEQSSPELFKQLTQQKADSGSGKINKTRTIDGRTFMKKNGQWLELVK